MEPTTTKNYFQLNKGLNTESSELEFPDGYTTDELNYELLRDGSRRRRKGLDQESGGADLTIPTITTTQKYKAYKWRAVGGDPLENQIVVQVGNRLYFMDDVETPSSTWKSSYINMTSLAAPSATSALIANNPVSFAVHRGYLLVAGRYVEPFYVEYIPGTDSYQSTIFSLVMRDFEGVDDGVPITKKPAGTITDSHYYNLLNRGWKDADITAYKSSQSVNPAKNQIWWKGYKRTYGTNVNPADGDHAFNATKMAAERVGGGDAPQGSLRLNVFDTNQSEASFDQPNNLISTWSESDNGDGTWDVTIDTDEVHGLTHPATVEIRNFTDKYYDGVANIFSNWLNGIYTTKSVSDTDTFVITVDAPPNFVSWTTKYLENGYVLASTFLTNPDGVAYDERPSVVASHDGHVFWAGINNSAYADTVFFGQLGTKPSVWGRCYQQNDPTDPDLNEIGPADGGVIIIPNMGTVTEALSTRSGLLLFTDHGVWEISGGRRGVFTADGYSVRKITDAEANSPYSIVEVDQSVLYTGPKGIHMLSPNQYTDELEETNISDPLIRTLWNNIHHHNKARVQACYDDAQKRVIFLYDDDNCTNANQYNRAIILDMVSGGYFRYGFNTDATKGIVACLAITDADNPNTNSKVKYFTPYTATSLRVCDMYQGDYIDFDGAEMPSAYMLTGYGYIGDHQRRRQAPIVTCYSKRTETGYTFNDGFQGFVSAGADGISSVWVEGKDLSINGNEAFNGFTMKPDGTKFYLHDLFFDSFKEYTMSTPWDVETASLTYTAPETSGSPPGGGFYSEDIAFSSDGTKFYAFQVDPVKQVRVFNLSTPWDLSTLAWSHDFAGTAFAVATNWENMHWSHDGKHLFLGVIDGSLYRYTPVTPWELPTTVNSFDAGQIWSGGGLDWGTFRNWLFTENGTRCFVFTRHPTIGNGRLIKSYSFSIPYDLSGASVKTYEGSFGTTYDVGGMKMYYNGDNMPGRMFFGPLGREVRSIPQQRPDDVLDKGMPNVEYAELPLPLYTTFSNSGDLPTTVDKFLGYSLTGDRTFFGSSSTGGLDERTNDVADYWARFTTSTATATLASGFDSASLLALNTKLGTYKKSTSVLRMYALPTADTISGLTDSDITSTIDISSTHAVGTITDVSFHEDGTGFLVCGATTVTRWVCSVPYDLTTATLHSTSPSITSLTTALGSPPSQFVGALMSSDLTQFLGCSTGNLYWCTMSTPGDLSTLVAEQKEQAPLSVSFGTVKNMRFNTSRNRYELVIMYNSGSGEGRIVTTGVPSLDWDVSSFTAAEYSAVNSSSTLMYALWDWVGDPAIDPNEADTGKKTQGWEIYRNVRMFTPDATTDLDGYPVVVTRNKVRGRGRALQLKFEAGSLKDSHILGYTVNYKVSRRI